ncbi:unnamed protein product [Agarophyton chilense]|eukprot:gb/GEZJ01004676.1/.p1 GENE.gb/GEZJ01004676.1/~~gb/GEZJ01004676.1/.p1  ORF type:complete len:463 (-),score=44.72 gb/GEZJ01004676.1/:1201-2547(-)
MYPLSPPHDDARSSSSSSFPAITPPNSPPSPTPQQQQWQLPADCTSFEHIQALIRQISRDPSLSEAEKSRRRQTIFTHRFRQSQSQQAQSYSHQLQANTHHISYSRVLDPVTGEPKPGCEHYPRNCKLRAACCGLWVVCRLCHDHNMDHEMVRFHTTQVRCMLCDREQPVSNKCVQCNVHFARYFCAICKFYDDTPDKDIYHCHKCKICRVGKGIGHDNFHCDRCDACISIELSKGHHCLKKSLDANCPICGAYLFTSTRPVVFMRCGHTMHAHCFDDYTVENFRCPLCQKALTNMSSYYSRIDEMLKREVMPPEHRNQFSEILCHDCDKRSTTTFHFEHHKCQHPPCGSYNTRVLRTFRRDGAKDSEAASSSLWQGDGMRLLEREAACAGAASGSASGGGIGGSASASSAAASRLDCESRACEDGESRMEDGQNSSGENMRTDDVHG